MKWDHVILNGTLVTAAETYKANIYIKDGKIAAITSDQLDGEADEITDAAGKYVLPGFIDSHVHSRDGRNGALYKEDFFHSSMAGACGGVTTIIEQPNTNPTIHNVEMMDSLNEIIAPKAHVDFGNWGLCIGKLNNADLPKMAEHGAAAFKFFWGYALDLNTKQLIYNYKEGMPNVLPPLDDGEIFTIFREVAKTGKVLGIHGENFWLIKQLTAEVMASSERGYDAVLKARPAINELTVIETAIRFAQATGVRLHIVHVCVGEAVEVIRRAQREGINVTAETCPHYLFLSDEDYDTIGDQLKVYPPIRTKRDQELLWEGLRDGTISTVVTDHAPHTLEEKMKNYWEAPAGIIGIETASMLMLTAVNEGKCTLNQVAAWMSENVAKIFNYYPRKGSLQVGTDADLAIIDLDQEYTFDQAALHSRTKLSPYHGKHMKGRVVQTILRGMTIAKDGDIVGNPRGKWVKSQ